MAPLFAAASLHPVLSPYPAAAARVAHGLSSRTPGLGSRVRLAAGATGRGRGQGQGQGRGIEGGIPDEWGERFPPAPEPPSKPDPPIDNDEWGRDADSGNSSPVIADEWGEPGEPEAEPPSAADPPSPGIDDEWEEELPAPAPDEGAGSQVNEAAERREELKRCLVDTVYGTELGFRASTEVRGEVVELVTQLEVTNPTPAPIEAPYLLDGNWILL
jgi:hypothetical protein